MNKIKDYFDENQINKIKSVLNKYNQDLLLINQDNGIAIVTKKAFGFLTEIYGYDDSYLSFRSMSSKRATAIPMKGWLDLKKGEPFPYKFMVESDE